MEQVQRTSATFTILVEIFLGLVTTKALDTSLVSYKNKALLPINLLLLASLVIVLIHSFSIFLQVSSQQTYSALLNQRVHRRRINILLIAGVCVFIILYLMADFFSGNTIQFLVIALLLSLGWFVIDFNSTSLIYTYYADQNRLDDVESDPLYIATSKWWVLDIILSILFLILLVSIYTKLMQEHEAACAMIFFFLAAALIVELSLPRDEIKNEDDSQTLKSNG